MTENNSWLKSTILRTATITISIFKADQNFHLTPFLSGLSGFHVLHKGLLMILSWVTKHSLPEKWRWTTVLDCSWYLEIVINTSLIYSVMCSWHVHCWIFFFFFFYLRLLNSLCNFLWLNCLNSEIFMDFLRNSYSNLLIVLYVCMEKKSNVLYTEIIIGLDTGLWTFW